MRSSAESHGSGSPDSQPGSAPNGDSSSASPVQTWVVAGARISSFGVIVLIPASRAARGSFTAQCPDPGGRPRARSWRGSGGGTSLPLESACVDGEAAVSGEAGGGGGGGLPWWSRCRPRSGLCGRVPERRQGCTEGHQFLGPFWTPKQQGSCRPGWLVKGLRQPPSSNTWKARACVSGPTF